MQANVHTRLNSVRLRQRWQFALKASVAGLFVSTAAAIAVGIWKYFTAQSLPITPGALLIAAGPVMGLIVGLLWRRPWTEAAVAVDSHYSLKDRALTALEFAQKTDESKFYQLQLADAAMHLQKVEAARVVPMRVPRMLPYASASLVLAVALVIWQPTNGQLQASLVSNFGIINVAEEIGIDLEELEKFAEQQQNEQLIELVEQLREKAEEMKEPGVDVREALAKLSEMQAAIAAERAQYNEALVDSQLQSLGAAMAAADGLKSVGQKLEKGEFEKAAEELEQMEDLKLKRREAKSAAEKMKKVAKKMGEAGLGQISDSVSEMSDGISSGQSSKTSKGAKQLAKSLRKHNTRRKVNQLLWAEFKRLSECKSQCQACQGFCKKCGSGQCQGQCNSLAEGLNPKKSTTPSQNWGKGTSGNVNGEWTKLASERNLQILTGQLGDGPSDIETSTTPEGREQSRRGYREVYQEYRKLSEAVLDQEPIPLGQRQTIRRYFELIRPQNSSDESSTGPPGSSKKD